MRVSRGPSSSMMSDPRSTNPGIACRHGNGCVSSEWRGSTARSASRASGRAPHPASSAAIAFAECCCIAWSSTSRRRPPPLPRRRQRAPPSRRLPQSSCSATPRVLVGALDLLDLLGHFLGQEPSCCSPRAGARSCSSTWPYTAPPCRPPACATGHHRGQVRVEQAITVAGAVGAFNLFLVVAHAIGCNVISRSTSFGLVTVLITISREGESNSSLPGRSLPAVTAPRPAVGAAPGSPVRARGSSTVAGWAGGSELFDKLRQGRSRHRLQRPALALIGRRIIPGIASFAIPR
jgi:hypothetical protein